MPQSNSYEEKIGEIPFTHPKSSGAPVPGLTVSLSLAHPGTRAQKKTQGMAQKQAQSPAQTQAQSRTRRLRSVDFTASLLVIAPQSVFE
jgi:hypothetical protein